MKIRLLFFSLLALPFLSLGQELEFNKNFLEANQLMEEKFYNKAIHIWLRLIKKDSENANLNYKLGLCYLNSPNQNERSKSLLYLQLAATNTTTNYNAYDPAEKQAPIEAIYHLGRAYHLNWKLDEAIEQYQKFELIVNEDHRFYLPTDRQIEMCFNAKEQIANPKDYKIENMTAVMNTEYPEYGPVVSVDENAIFFTSRRLRPDSSNENVIDDVAGMHYEDVYVSYRDRNTGKWLPPELLSFSTAFSHEATISTSADGQILYIYKDDNGDGNIYESKLNGETWSTPEKLISDVNSKYWETHAALSADGNTIYFVSDRPGGFGGRDIYRCVKLPTGQWSKALTIGPEVNTPYDEDAVFIHPDGKTLYFSSQGHNSMGGFDIFYTVLQDNGKWSKPINIGYPVNTVDDDIYFVTSADGRRAYYSSIRENGLGEKDVYLINLPGSEVKDLTVLKGYIIPPDGEKVPESTVVIVTNKETGQSEQYKPRVRDGAYVIILPQCQEYALNYKVDDESIYQEDIQVPCESSYLEINKEILLNTVNLDSTAIDDSKLDTEEEPPVEEKKEEKLIVGKISSSAPVTYIKYFKYNVNDIKEDEVKFQTLVAEVDRLIKESGAANVSIESSASKVPTTKYKSNKSLAEKRSSDAKNRLMDALKEKGIDQSKVNFVSMKSLVQGPDYKNDANSNRKEYEKYQYIKITAK